MVDSAEDDILVTIGVNVVAKVQNSTQLFFYKTKLKDLRKSELLSFVPDNSSNAETLEILEDTIRAYINKNLEEFLCDTKDNRLVKVLEGDLKTIKFINVDSIQEVTGFISYPRMIKQ
ncbi:hypothetical protein ACR77J_08005 [Tissierella praeacuta]|uniref:hypothetical protein n=1 Tax=Tissierella praeacuta TaxID=43131 RepID=UPI003DA46B8F